MSHELPEPLKPSMPSTDRVDQMDMEGARLAIRSFLTALGHKVDSDGLRDTPRRVSEAFVQMTAGYFEHPEKLLSVTFEAEKYDEIVALADISFVSMCEHHLLPFTGKAGVAYVPKAKVVGLSKLARVVDVYARRLQLQERLTKQVAEAIAKYLDPIAVAVVIEAEHSCMTCRGAMKPGAVMRTSSMQGTFRTNPAARAEALRLLGV